MNNFELYNPVKLVFGKNQISKLADLLPKNAKVMVIYGGGSIFKNGVYAAVKENLSSFEWSEFGGIEPNPHFETCMKAVEAIKKHGSTFLLAVGGGSVIDATKFIAAATCFQGDDPWKLISEKAPVLDALPFGTVLTLPATGSEMNSGAVITKAATKEKMAFGSPLSFPKFSIVDPVYAASLPHRQIANGIVDAFTHTVEQYITYDVNTPLQDRYAESILKTLIEEGPKALANPQDYDAMANLVWCATSALNGQLRVGVATDWGTHGVGHELTALHGIDHARTLAIVLPGVWKVFRTEKKTKLLQYGARVWNITEGSEEERIEKTIQATVDFFESLGVPTTLDRYDLGQPTIEQVVGRFKARNWTAIGDRQLFTQDKIAEILNLQLAL